VSATSITSRCEAGKADNRFGKNIIVVDTPGLFDTKVSNEMMVKEIGRCITITAPGPHAIILVVQVGRITKEERQTVEFFVNHFGEEMFRYLIILFTRKDDLRKTTLHSYINTIQDDVREIFGKTNNRFVAFNNFSTCNGEMDKDVKYLLQQIENIQIQNGGSHYTNDMYKEAEKKTIQRMNEVRMEEQKKNDKALEAIELKFKQKHEKQMREQISKQKENERILQQLKEKEDQIQIEKLKKKMKEEEESKRNLQQRMKEEREQCLKEQTERFTKVIEAKHRRDEDRKEQGLISSAWSGIKGFFGYR